MALNLKSPEVARLVCEVAALSGESKTEAVRQALAERLTRLAFRASSEDRGARLQRFLEGEAWPTVPPAELGRRLSREEWEAILGIAEEPAERSPVDPR